MVRECDLSDVGEGAEEDGFRLDECISSGVVGAFGEVIGLWIGFARCC